MSYLSCQYDSTCRWRLLLIVVLWRCWQVGLLRVHNWHKLSLRIKSLNVVEQAQIDFCRKEFWQVITKVLVIKICLHSHCRRCNIITWKIEIHWNLWKDKDWNKSSLRIELRNVVHSEWTNIIKRRIHENMMRIIYRQIICQKHLEKILVDHDRNFIKDSILNINHLVSGRIIWTIC